MYLSLPTRPTSPTARIQLRLLISMVALALLLATCVVAPANAAEPALIRIERLGPGDRTALIDAGIDLVAEMDTCLLALGDPSEIAKAAAQIPPRPHETRLLDATPEGRSFAIAGPRHGATRANLEACGEVVWQDVGWALLRGDDLGSSECLGSPWLFLRPLDMSPLRPARRPPAEYEEAQFAGTQHAGTQHGTTLRLETNPLVTDMVVAADDAYCMGHWQSLVSTTTTRYSRSTGCVDAAANVYGLFDALGLEPEYQEHSTGHAPNVLGTIPGRVSPEEIVVVIGHLDDLPSSGPAPGADDNGSGSAMVVAVAEVMADYDFARTVRFLTVTGEEQGLYGSEHAAAAAAAAGENIYAVLNGDMIGWEGDGQPATEDLDLDYNTASTWLGTVFAQTAADYPTGCVVNAFSCGSMVYSDHAPFWSEGYSAVCGITDNEGFCSQSGSYPNYHQSTDTISACGSGAETFYGGAVRAYLAAAAHLAEPLCHVSPVPTGLAAAADGAGRIAVSWAEPAPDLGYEVLRTPGGCASGAPARVIGSTSAASLVDTTASGGVTYGYRVRARHASGYCISPESQCVEASTTGDCTEPPWFDGISTVTNAAQQTCSLELSWPVPQQVFCGTEVRYTVYRSTAAGFTPGPANRIASSLNATSFTDVGTLLDRVAYYYVVRAVDTSNDAEDSNTHEATAAPTGVVSLGTWLDDGGDTGDAKLSTASPWTLSPTGGNDHDAVYLTGDYGNQTCSALTTPTISLGDDPWLAFWSHYDIESGWDKGEVELSADDGVTWSRLEVGYPDTADHTSDACGLPAGDFFSGSSGSYLQYTASLAQWAGQEVQIRWSISSDGSLRGTGWWVDDVSVDPAGVAGICQAGPELIFADTFETGTTSAWSTTSGNI